MTESLPKSWTMTTLGEIADTTKRRVRPQDHPDKPYIGMEHIEAHTMRLLGTVPAKEMRSTAESFSAGDVLYGRLRPYLNKVYCPDFDGLCSTEFIPFRKKSVVDSKFLQYFLNSSEFVRFAAHLNEGDRPRVNFGQLKDYPMPLPPKEEQRKIVSKIEELFSQLDAATAALKHVQANLKRYKASVLKAACEGRLVPTEAELARREGRSYESGAELLERILKERRRRWEEEQRAKGKDPAKMKYPKPAKPDTEGLPELPEGWVWTNFGEVANFSKYALKAGPFGSTLKKEVYVSSGFKVYGQEQVIRENPYYGDYYIDEKKFSELESCEVKPNDILISLVGTIGKVLILPDNIEKGIINPRLIKFSPNLKIIEPRYIKIFMENPKTKQLYTNSSHGGTMDILNLSILKQLVIPLPPIVEQTRIADEVEERISVIQNIDQNLTGKQIKAGRLRQSILHQAFEGKIDN